MSTCDRARSGRYICSLTLTGRWPLDTQPRDTLVLLFEVLLLVSTAVERRSGRQMRPGGVEAEGMQ